MIGRRGFYFASEAIAKAGLLVWVQVTNDLKVLLGCCNGGVYGKVSKCSATLSDRFSAKKMASC